MIIDALEIQNLASLKGNWKIPFGEISQDKSLFLIHGKTGAGKSTILHALSIAIYGETAKKGHNPTDLVTIGESAAKAKVWLKIDTGMHRLGVAPTQLNDFYQRLQATNNAKDTINLMTHFSSADDVNDPKTAEQIALFDSLVQGKQQAHHLEF